MLGVHWEGSEWQDAARREKSLLEKAEGWQHIGCHVLVQITGDFDLTYMYI